MTIECYEVLNDLTKEVDITQRKITYQVVELQKELLKVRNRKVRFIFDNLERLLELKKSISIVLERNKDSFKKPKTKVMNNLRIGFSKTKAEVAWYSAEDLIKAIEEDLSHIADQLIKTTKKPLKNALLQLTPKEAELIGLTILPTEDAVLIKTVNKETEKLINEINEEYTKLLKKKKT